MMHKTKQGALKAARDAMGDDAIEGIDFYLLNNGAGWVFEQNPPANGDALAAMEAKLDAAPKAFLNGKIKIVTDVSDLVPVKDMAGNTVYVAKDEPLVVDGVLQPNKTRATEAKKPKVERAPKAEKPAPKVKAPPKPREPKKDGATSKGDLILSMLRANGGATSQAMEKATGWQPHSVRGFLGTLRSKGVKVVSTKEPKQPTVYSLSEPGDVV